MRTTRRRLPGITAAAFAAGVVLAVPAHAAPPAPQAPEAPEHNARVAEYLMQSHTGLHEHNARVAEYLSMSQAH